MAARTDRYGYLDLTPDQSQAMIAGDFATFVRVMYAATKGPDLIWAPYLGFLCAKLQDVAEGREKRVLITMPPRHLKSFTVSVALPAFLLGNYPDQQIMVVSYGQDLAKEFARDCLNVMSCDNYREAFVDVALSARQPLHAIRTRHGGVRRATSIDGTATGVGADLIIFDDPQKPGETLSEAMRRSTNAALENTFMSRGNQPQTLRIVIVMQRLHEEDFAAHALSLGGDWTVINLPAIAEEDEAFAYETFMGPKIFRRKAGEALHPARISLADLAVIRKSSGEAIFATQYQQRPAPAGGGLVQTKWFRRYAQADLPNPFDRIVQSWDTANKAEEFHDFSVCTTWGVKGTNTYLLNVFRKRLIFPDLKRALIEQLRLHRATEVFVEDHASGTQLLQELRAENFGMLRPVLHTRDKQIRMTNQTARIENGLVHIPTEAPWLDDYLHELEVFPNGKHDDQVDSTSQALDNIFAWANGSGLYEFYRQEDEARRRREAALWILQPPPGMTMVAGIEGTLYRPDANGHFHLPRKDALPLINQIGWKIIYQPE